tara:strand:- start:720 stop:956 length:237 start_codon:yes stop_codon:yes gene_type:complete
MEFKLSTSCTSYYRTSEITMLEELGFVFDDIDDSGCRVISGSPTIEISSIERLMELNCILGAMVVDGCSIEIYDGHRE